MDPFSVTFWASSLFSKPKSSPCSRWQNTGFLLHGGCKYHSVPRITAVLLKKISFTYSCKSKMFVRFFLPLFGEREWISVWDRSKQGWNRFQECYPRFPLPLPHLFLAGFKFNTAALLPYYWHVHSFGTDKFIFIRNLAGHLQTHLGYFIQNQVCPCLDLKIWNILMTFSMSKSETAEI